MGDSTVISRADRPLETPLFPPVSPSPVRSPEPTGLTPAPSPSPSPSGRGPIETIADDRATLMAYRAGAEGNVPAPAAEGLLIHMPDGNDYYKVVAGDKGCVGIAMKIWGDGNKWHVIAKANPGLLDPGKLMPGQMLLIPPLARVAPTTRPGPGGGVTTRAAGEIYKIKDGDILESIAKAKYGDGTLWREIVKVNPGLDPNHLKIGQEIVLPDLRRTTMPATGPASRAVGVRRPPAPSPTPAPTRGGFD